MAVDHDEVEESKVRVFHSHVDFVIEFFQLLDFLAQGLFTLGVGCFLLFIG